MKRSHTHRGRFYDEEGKKYPSVTTILSCVAKPALVNWSASTERAYVIEEAANFYERLCEQGHIGKIFFTTLLAARLDKRKAQQREMEKAGEIGTQVHSFIEWTLKGELLHEVGPAPLIGQEAQESLSKWNEWRASVNLRPLFVESAVVSRKHGYAGTMDYLCAEVNGVETLCDWKTGKRVYYEAHLQNAAYRVAAREMGISDPRAGLILRLPKTIAEPTFEAVPARDEAECFEVFLAVKKLWEDMQKEDKWLKAQDTTEETISNTVAEQQGHAVATQAAKW